MTLRDSVLQDQSAAVVPDASQAPAVHGPERADCAVVVVTYNSAGDIAGLLDSLPAAAAGLRVRVIVVDNGSTDGTVALVRSHPDVTCVETGANLGYAGGINVGRSHGGEYSTLLVLNPDARLEAGALRELLAALDDPAVGVVVPMLLDAEGRRLHSLRREPALMRALGDALLGGRVRHRPGLLSEMVWQERPYGHRHPVDWATGAAMLVSAACDRAVGCWDERFFLYSEETDYFARARAAGFRVDYQPSARVCHRGGGSGRSDALLALQAVNRVRYMEKHHRWPRPYWLTVILHEMLRSGSPGHRGALLAVLHRSGWDSMLRRFQSGS
jgi:GT2 family glycosyltransferase